MNVHSHHPASQPDEWVIRNVRLGVEPIPETLPPNTRISIGIHPWDIREDWPVILSSAASPKNDCSSSLSVILSSTASPKNDCCSSLSVILSSAASPKNDLAAIGECGFDRLRGPSIALQHAVFEAHIRLAESWHLPVIVHCVKAYEDLLTALRRLKPAVPVIIHGFDKHPQLAQDLLRAGCYLSFGSALLRAGSSAAKSLVITPEDRFLLETDDAPADIRQIYAAAAAVRGQEISEIRSRVRETWTHLSAISPA